MFFDLLLYCASFSDPVSLENAVTILSDCYGIEISKQALDDRFHDRAVKFVQEILKQVLELELGYLYTNNLLPQFNYVRIKDSTKFNVDSRLEKQFQGSGGNGTRKACVCIQYEYDIKSGKILDLSITSGVINDASNAKMTMHNISARDLVIRDLGYYNLNVLLSFDKNNAFFISRLNMCTILYNVDTGDLISFGKLYKEMLQKKLGSIEFMALVSQGKKAKLRVILSIMPEEEYQKRLRNTNKKNKEKGHTTSDNYKERARFNIFITNVPEDMLTEDEILSLYKLRWQIELTFKIWKSICAINKLQGMKYERYVCLLMAKLILIVIRLQLYWNIYAHFYNSCKKMLSPYKCFKTFQSNFQKLWAIIKSEKKVSEKNIRTFIKMFSKNHWKKKRKKRANYIEIIELFVCKTDIYDYICGAKEKVA